MNLENRPLLRRVLALAAFLVIGLALSQVGAPATRWQAARQPAFHAASIEASLGQGALLALFGGLRGFMADVAWVRAYTRETESDPSGFDVCARLAIALAPDNAFFWKNYAYTVSYDMPHWEIEERERVRGRPLPAASRERIFREHARRGLDILERGAAACPDEQATLRERGALLLLNKLGDRRTAAAWLRKAAECPKPTWWASTAYPTILARDLGARDEARAWLRERLRKITAGEIRDDLRLRGEFETRLRALESTAPKQ